MEPCKIRSTTKPRTHAPGLEGKEMSSPSSRGKTMSLTSPLIDQAISLIDHNEVSSCIRTTCLLVVNTQHARRE
jgi:hypothetical protein